MASPANKSSKSKNSEMVSPPPPHPLPFFSKLVEFCSPFPNYQRKHIFINDCLAFGNLAVGHIYWIFISLHAYSLTPYNTNYFPSISNFQGFKYFSTYLRGREELIVTIKQHRSSSCATKVRLFYYWFLRKPY